MGTSLLKKKLKHSYSEKGQSILCIKKEIQRKFSLARYLSKPYLKISVLFSYIVNKSKFTHCLLTVKPVTLCYMSSDCALQWIAI